MPFSQKDDFWKYLNMTLSALICLLVILFSNSYAGSKTVDLNFKKIILWGPGINVDSVMPVRYFYLQMVDLNGEK